MDSNLVKFTEIATVHYTVETFAAPILMCDSSQLMKLAWYSFDFWKTRKWNVEWFSLSSLFPILRQHSQYTEHQLIKISLTYGYTKQLEKKNTATICLV